MANELAAIAVCSTCGTPGKIVFDEHGNIVRAFFACKCPRPTVEEANKK